MVVIDSLEALPPGARRRVFGAGRATEEGGTLTVLAAVGDDARAAALGDHAAWCWALTGSSLRRAAPCAPSYLRNDLH